MRCPNLTELSASKIDDEGLLALSMITHSTLTDLSFRHDNLTDSAVDRLCKGCPYLTRLSLGFWNDLTDASVRSIVKYCPWIEQLSLGGWGQITDDAMIALTALTSLKEISLSDRPGLTSAGVQQFLIGNGANLEVLTLSEGGNYSTCFFCDDAFLRCIGSYCPKLRNLCTSVGLNTHVTEATYITLVRGCPLLENFQVYCKKVSDTVRVELAASCPRLTALDLSYAAITDIGFTALTRECKHLEKFSLHNPDHINPQSFASSILQCAGLKELDLFRVQWLTDQSLPAIFPALTQLTDVILAGSPLITDQSILVLARSCPKIERLHLYYLPSLTERSISVFAAFEGLKDLSIGDCSTLTHHTVRAIACHCKKLISVKLSDCPLVTELGVIDILTHGKRLTYVSITRCNVTLTTELDAHLQRRLHSSRRVRVEILEPGLGQFTL